MWTVQNIHWKLPNLRTYITVSNGNALLFIQRIPICFMENCWNCRKNFVAEFVQQCLHSFCVKWYIHMTVCMAMRVAETITLRESVHMTFSNMLTVPLANCLQESVFLPFTSKLDAELHDSPILLTGLSVLWRLTHFLCLNKIVKVDMKYYFAIVIRIALSADINSEF